MSRSKFKGQGHRAQKDKKTAESSPLTMHSKACAVRCTQQQTTPLRRSRGVTGWRQYTLTASVPVGKSAHAVYFNNNVAREQFVSNSVRFLRFFN